MSPESTHEFRHYRLTLGAIGLGLTTLAIVWLAGSVAVDLFVRPASAAPAERFSGAADDVAGMLECQAKVESLYDELGALFGRLATGQAAGDAELRQRFERGWPERWRTAGSECRFEELRDHGLGAAYDHLAWVHAQLDEVHRGDAVLLESYIAQHEPRIVEIRRALETSRQTLERRRADSTAAPRR